jgi:hypothetical protein
VWRDVTDARAARRLGRRTLLRDAPRFSADRFFFSVGQSSLNAMAVT